MGTTQDRYQSLDIYICKAVYQPKGVCYGKTCKPKSITETDETISGTVKTYINGVLVSKDVQISSQYTQIDAYMTQVGFDTLSLSAYILADGDDEACLLSTPSCSDFDPLEMNVPWSRVGSEIIALLPLPEHCAVEKFLTSYPDNALSYSTPSHVGETDGESLALTFDAGGYVPHKTHLDDTHLIPGEVVSVSYKVNGFEEYHLLGVIDFQTNIFTTATFIGCGLVDRVKVYNNPAQPELGYTYEYQPSEGGIGVQLSDEWIFDTRLRFAVEYRGEVYWLKSVDSSVYELDSRVTVIRGINESPLIPDQNLDQTCTTDTLSETNDRITQDYFYV